jgi:hypothetical protein
MASPVEALSMLFQQHFWFGSGSVLIYGARHSRRFNVALQIDVEAWANLGLAMKPALRKQLGTLPGSDGA